LLRELFRLVRRPESVDFLFQDCNLGVFSGGFFVEFALREVPERGTNWCAHDDLREMFLFGWLL
jgi:hypothetical protein